MVESQESAELKINETDSIIQESRERIRQALELEGNKLKEKAKQDSAQILAEAKKEADNIVAQARQEAKVQAEQILAKAKEEAEQNTRESREIETKARQESAKVIHETREKASQIITEVIDRGTKQAQSELAQVSSEAKNKTSQLLAQVSQGIEQIIGEAETNIKAELERLKTTISEAETKPQPLQEAPNKEADTNSQPATAEAVMLATSTAEKTKPEIPPVAEKRAAPLRESKGGKLFKGRLKLEIISPYNQAHQGGVQEWLGQHHGLKVISTGGHASANRWITNQTIDLEEPMPILDILKSVPGIKDIAEHKENIVITMR